VPSSGDYSAAEPRSPTAGGPPSSPPNHATQALGPVGPDGGPLAFDGYSCCWYREERTFLESLQTAEWASVAAAAPNLFDTEWSRGMSASLDPRTIIDGDYGPFKTVWVCRFKDEIRVDPAYVRKAHERWVKVHGQFGRDVPGIGRYVQNHCIAPIGGAGPNDSIELEFDGFSECWFQNRAAFNLAMSSPEWLAMNEDAENLFDLDYILGGMSAVIEENVVKGARDITLA
jgi:hypothetical protein